MELRDFIEETLTQIVEGVKAAQGRAKDQGARVNPHLTTSADLAAKQGILIASGSAAQLVQFDVAITVKEGTATKGGIGVALGVVALGSTGQSQAESASVSRVKFSVPLVLPDARG